MPASRTCWLARKNHAIVLGPVADCELLTTRSIARTPTRTIVPAGAATNRTLPTRERPSDKVRRSRLLLRCSRGSPSIFSSRDAAASLLRACLRFARQVQPYVHAANQVPECAWFRSRYARGAAVQVERYSKSTVGLAWAHVQCCLRYHC